MTYQHEGKRYTPSVKEDYISNPSRHITKRYFMLDFQCSRCSKSNRLKQLKVNFLEKFQCPYCNNNTFEVVKRRVGETSIREKDTVIIVEKRSTGGRRVQY